MHTTGDFPSNFVCFCACLPRFSIVVQACFLHGDITKEISNKTSTELPAEIQRAKQEQESGEA
jgi:hypothetical protein